ncbi:hypothetical protein NIES4073_31130 [Kalymmatonema gypsitolerans NIES-4073]|nr:hypothetical protein NIES4073_31130 [Scytonema sp. NIES-4073]
MLLICRAFNFHVLKPYNKGFISQKAQVQYATAYHEEFPKKILILPINHLYSIPITVFITLPKMSQPTIGQLEREITHRIRSLYTKQLGHRPHKIICQFFDTELAISIENSVSVPEQTLVRAGYEILAEQVRLDLNKIIAPQIKDLIEEIIKKAVVDLLLNTNLITGRTGIIVFLEALPEVRNRESIPKANCKIVQE